MDHFKVMDRQVQACTYVEDWLRVDIASARAYPFGKLNSMPSWKTEWILNNPEEVEGKLVVINVDSQSAILALEQVNVYSKSLAATLDFLNKAADLCDTLKTRSSKRYWMRSKIIQ